MSNIFFYSFLFWFVLAVVAILNGIFRQSFLLSKFGELRAHQLSSFTLSFFIFLLTYVFFILFGFGVNSVQAFVIGVIWLVMTIIFEFGFGHYVVKHSWQKLFADYNLKEGRIWILVLLVTLFAPLIVSLFL